MSIFNVRSRKERSPPPPLEHDLGVAERHLAELAKMQRPVPAEARTLPMPRARRVGRRVAGEAERLNLALEWVRHAAAAPHHSLGRFRVRFRLKLKALLNRELLAALAVLSLAALWRLVLQPSEGSLGYVVSSIFFGAALIGAIAAGWNDLVRCPRAARRIRRRIARHPESVLSTTSPLRQAELMARDEQMPIVPREDLFDEVLPGILDRRRSDVQMVVGEPGAGKTTALVGLAERLARMGFVPVVVPIGGEMPKDLTQAAEERFKQHAGSLIGSNARLEELWRWLRLQGRVVVAIDDIDRMAPDGERGFMLRRALDELAGADLPAVVTTRPAGIPAGLAASAIDLDVLDQRAAVEHVLRVARAEPGSLAQGLSTGEVRGNVARWVKEGRFAEVPFYLELLARLVAVGRCQELVAADAVLSERGVRGDDGRVRERGDGRCEWNPLWVRFRLLENFYDEVVGGRVHRWLAIEARERTDCLEALSEVALSMLAATAIQARESAHESEEKGSKSRRALKRRKIEEFLKSDDRARFGPSGERRAVSAHEVVDTGERLRILDRDPDGELLFHHRIMQAYLAGRCLARQDARDDERSRGDWLSAEPPDWVGALLDPYYPDRLTAHMTLTFAALCAFRSGPEGEKRRASGVPKAIVKRLVLQASATLPDSERRSADGAGGDDRLDPRKPFHPEEDRADPDDALAKLTTAAEIARATGAAEVDVKEIVRYARRATGATMWTKLHAIPSVAALDTPKGWVCVWEFARDPDQEVRRAASEAIEADAFAAYRSLKRWIRELLDRAALRSARGLSLESPDLPMDGTGPDGRATAGMPSSDGYRLVPWDASRDIPGLQALGWILPAIVSGLRENLDGLHADVTPEVYAEDVRGAREALERFVRLAFQGEHPELEASLAQGFKRDAMYHADDPHRSGGPGLVANNRRLLTDLCIDNVDYWYARLVLYQALALYAIAGSSRQVAFDAFDRLLGHGGEPHPFVDRAARLARRAVRRRAIGSDRWRSLIWVDEGVAVSRRPTEMSSAAAQLVADVTLLLNLRAGAPEDPQAHFPRMQELPHCLQGSRDRREILGAGCPAGCRYGFCPLRQPPPDEPNGQRTVSRAFCRGQYEFAAHHKPAWHRRIRRRALQEFWRQMERRART